MPPSSSMPVRPSRREDSRWRPYGISTPSTSQPHHTVAETIFKPVPPQNQPKRRSAKYHAPPRPLQYKDSNQGPPRSSLSPPTTHYGSDDFTMPTSDSMQHMPSRPVSESLDHPTLIDSRVKASDEDLPPLPELRTEKPMLACSNTLVAKRLVAQCVATIQDIWCLAPERATPPANHLVGHVPPTNAPPPPPNPITLPPPNPEAVAAAASVDAELMLTPPGSPIPQQQSASPNTSVSSDEGESDDDGANDSPAQSSSSPLQQAAGPSTFSGSFGFAQFHGPSPPPATSVASASAMPPSSFHQYPPPYSYNTPSSSSHSNASHGSASHNAPSITHPPQTPAPEVIAAQTMVPSPHAQHLLYFAHEVLRRSRTSCVTLEIAMCYIGAIRDLVRNLLTERAHLTRLARQQGCTPQQLDRRGVFTCPLYDPRRTILAALVLATKFHQDRAYSNKAWAKLSGLPGKEVTRCENALGVALDWRLWVGRIPPTAASLLGVDTPAPPQALGVDATSDATPAVASPTGAARCVSPPLVGLSVDMLEQELLHEELMFCGVHATFGGRDGIPGERDARADSFIEAARRAELSRVPVPRTRAPTVARSVPAPSAAISQYSAPSQTYPLDMFLTSPFTSQGQNDDGFSLTGATAARVMEETYGIAGPSCLGIRGAPAPPLPDMVMSAAEWNDTLPTATPVPLPLRRTNSPLRRSSSVMSQDSLLGGWFNEAAHGQSSTTFVSCGRRAGPVRRGGLGYQTPAPSSQGSVSVDGGDLMDRSICGSPEQGSPRAFERSITGTPRQSSMGAEEIPFPKTPRLAESAIPLSSIVGAFRPQRSPPPLVVVAPSNDQSIVWHPPPNYYSRSLTPPAEFQMLPAK